MTDAGFFFAFYGALIVCLGLFLWYIETQIPHQWDDME